MNLPRVLPGNAQRQFESAGNTYQDEEFKEDVAEMIDEVLRLIR